MTHFVAVAKEKGIPLDSNSLYQKIKVLLEENQKTLNDVDTENRQAEAT